MWYALAIALVFVLVINLCVCARYRAMRLDAFGDWLDAHAEWFFWTSMLSLAGFGAAIGVFAALCFGTI